MPGPVVHCCEGLRLSEVKHDDYCVTILVIEGQKRAETLLSCGVPYVDGEGVSARVARVEAMVASAQGVGDFILEVAVEKDLDEAGFADV